MSRVNQRNFCTRQPKLKTQRACRTSVVQCPDSWFVTNQLSDLQRVTGNARSHAILDAAGRRILVWMKARRLVITSNGARSS
jgi:hypothetical protein